jgi:hypothetical protein
MPRKPAGETAYKTKSKEAETTVKKQRGRPRKWKAIEEPVMTKVKEKVEPMEDITEIKLDKEPIFEKYKDLDRETRDSWIKFIKDVKIWAGDRRIVPKKYNDSAKFYYNILANSPNSMDMLNRMKYLFYSNLHKKTIEDAIPVRYATSDKPSSSTQEPIDESKYNMYQAGENEYVTSAQPSSSTQEARAQPSSSTQEPIDISQYNMYQVGENEYVGFDKDMEREEAGPSVTGYTDQLEDEYLRREREKEQEELDKELREKHMGHINNIKNLLEKEPKLKDDIKKIIVDQLVKAKIKPEQYNELKQQIESLEVPQAIRAKRTSKPRAKKSQQYQQTDIPMIIDKEYSPLPKSKEPKSRQKKKDKVVDLGVANDEIL